MNTRRTLLKMMAALGVLAVTPLGWADAEESLVMPDESAPQERVWVAFAASRAIWGRSFQEVQATIGRLVRAMTPFTPVTVLCRPGEEALARRQCGERNVRFIPVALDDIWVRDSGGVFVRDGDGLALVDFNFNGWGEKQEHASDSRLAAVVAKASGARHLRANITGEGGGIEVDGEGTAIMTESCWLNDNRNPGVARAELEAELKGLLGLRKIIWLPGIKGRDITDAHVDFYARFVRPGVVVVNLDNDPDSHDYAVTREHLAILQGARDADGRALQLHLLPPPRQPRDNRFSRSPDFAAGYINYLPINGAVVIPRFGDPEADVHCQTLLGALYPGRKIVPVDIDPVAAGGGGIHCITLHQPS